MSDVHILLFADDIVLTSDTVQVLQQNIINIILFQISELLGLTVHTEKSKVVVFRNGGHLPAHEKWHTCTQNYPATKAKTAVIRTHRQNIKNVPNISIYK